MKNVLFNGTGKHKAASCSCMIYFVGIFIKTSFIFAEKSFIKVQFLAKEVEAT